jgi:hypothetical protein
MPRPLPDTFKTEARECAVRLYGEGWHLEYLFEPNRRGAFGVLARMRLEVAAEMRTLGRSWTKIAGALGYRSHTTLMERCNARRRGGSPAVCNPSIRGPQDVASGQCA